MSESAYALVEQFNAVLDGMLVVDKDTGEILWTKENLDQLQMVMAEKFRRCSIYGKNQHAQAEFYRNEAKRLTEIAKVYDKKSKAIEDYMYACLQECGGEIHGNGVTARIRKCPASVQVLDEESIPPEFWREKVTRTVDKAAIKEALKTGFEVPGCALVQNEKVEVK